MARGINKVILVGTLGRDPEMKYAANGNAIANLSVATSESWMDKNTGQKQEKTEWHRVVIFGKLAEVAGQYLKKGSMVYLEGKLQTRKWQDANTGQDRYSTEVVLSGFDCKMEMLGGGQGQRGDVPFDNGQSPSPQNFAQQAPQQRPPQATQQTQQGGYQGQPNNQYGQQPAQQPAPQQAAPMQQPPAYTPNDFADDDVPF